jgi:two-component system, cell cycle sensor histidine kinase and response regulator CckA
MKIIQIGMGIYKGRTMRQVYRCSILVLLFCLTIVSQGTGVEAPSKEGDGSRWQTVRLGVLANRGKEMCLTEWTPTAEYLSVQLAPKRFEIVPLNFDEVKKATEERRVEFLLVNSSMYVQLEYYGLVYRIATFQQPSPKGAGPLPVFGGVIFCRADRTDIRNLRDLRGKRFSAVEPSSLGGWHAAWREFESAGIHPHRDFAPLGFAGTHDAVVEAVRDGQADGGTVRSTQLERMAKEGRIELQEFRVLIGPLFSSSDYPFLLSTRLYPEWPFAAVEGTDLELGKSVASALLRMNADDPAARASRGSGWAIPQDYASVHECLKELRIPPYENYGRVTLSQAIAQYWLLALGILSVMVIILILAFFSCGTSVRLKESFGALRDSEQKYRAVIENMQDVYYRTDREGNLVLLSPSGARLIGLDSPELSYGMNVAREFYAIPEERDRLLQALKVDGAVSDYDVTLKRPDGKLMFVSTNSHIYRDANGEPLGVEGVFRDVTERKQAEEALMRANKYLENVFENSPEGIAIVDRSGKFIKWNRMAEELYGYSFDEMRGISAFHLYADKEELERMLMRLRQTGSVKKWEMMMKRKDGRVVPFEVSIALLRDSGNRTLGSVAVVRDLSDIKETLAALIASNDRLNEEVIERTRAEEALITANQQLNDIIEFLPDATFVIDREGKVIAWNRAIEEMTGISKKHMIGKGDHEFTIPFYGERRPHLLDLIGVSNEELESKYHSIQRKGNVLSAQTYVPCVYGGKGAHVFATGAPLLDIHGNHMGAIESIRDITEYKEAERALIESRQQLADIINFLPDATLVIDKYGKVIAWNRALEAMTGVEAEEMIGKGNYEYSLPFYGERRPILIDLALHPNQEMGKFYTAIQRQNDIVFGEAYTPSLPSGNVHLSGTASVLRDSKGEVVAAIECIRDNTERKRLEERLSRAEKMEALGTLAGGVAHDLNNVLGVLVGYSELLLEKIPKGDPLNRHVTHILQSSQRGAAIIQDLLTLARRGVAVSEVVNLNDIVADYLMSPEFEKLKNYHPNLTFGTDFEKGLLNIKGSPIHLEKTVMNLVWNAAEAISDEGEVMIRTENRYLDKPIRGYDDMQEGDYVVLTVSDNGKGIPPADCGKIFEPFYTKKAMGRSGTGLGLAVVWGTVKDHDGYIDVQSEEGKGSTFAIYLPITRDELSGEYQQISPDQYMGKGESILVVDDVGGQRELAVSMLTRLAYRACAVSSGEEAVAYIKTNDVDLLVLDMIMDPGMDGLDTYSKILEFHPRQKAIIVSGFAETDRVTRAQALGVGPYVKKPYVLEKLGLAVKKALERID